ncbi:NADP-dependent 3-hydroxy acid dehydrogenase YdfG [Fontimonas thermophila]|uniref:NADP-dependent 3-hydroxy acid dehydrogenase YdfG n=1 Tax=Fontimonas thermophila TaxID=1076937 RepID=A0A1I2JV06_9GAMM|nr:SDR family NAD(P)-dependent oxidoreductase [Fontimonas thermophila]SFF56621.1 NADP-dependent 3-hydroxy acid dehydrogenase YdfG [Fontimonas thermophila]
MQDLQDKVAVITGAGSGFGRAFAQLCAAEGMRLVLADIDEAGLAHTCALLPDGTETLTLRCDVADADAVQTLAERTYARFGACHLLFNNAGVAVAGPSWTTTLDDWRWVLGVNLMGVVHGVQSFVPRMLEQGDECHVVNTASVAGLLSVPGSSVYCVSKHGVVTLSECLHHELRAAHAKIGVSVLCPAFVPTGIADAERNRPARFAAKNPRAAPYEARVRKAVQSGKLSAADIARATMQAVKADRFYILTHPTIKAAIETRMRDILDERTPANPMP